MSPTIRFSEFDVMARALQRTKRGQTGGWFPGLTFSAGSSPCADAAYAANRASRMKCTAPIPTSGLTPFLNTEEPFVYHPKMGRYPDLYNYGSVAEFVGDCISNSNWGLEEHE